MHVSVISSKLLCLEESVLLNHCTALHCTISSLLWRSVTHRLHVCLSLTVCAHRCMYRWYHQSCYVWKNQFCSITALHCTALHCTISSLLWRSVTHRLHVCLSLTVCVCAHRCMYRWYHQSCYVWKNQFCSITALHCTAPYSIIPNCTALHCTTLLHTQLHYIALHCTPPFYTATYYTALHCTRAILTASYSATLHCTVLCHTALH